jgi:hypothetical protein
MLPTPGMPATYQEWFDIQTKRLTELERRNLSGDGFMSDSPMKIRRASTCQSQLPQVSSFLWT